METPVSEIESPQAVEEIANPLPAPAGALGHDPFDDLASPDRFEEQLDQLEARGKQKPEVRARARRAPKSKVTAASPTSARSMVRPATTRSDEHPPKPDNLARLTRRRWATTPPLAEIELPPTSSKARRPTIDSVTRRRR